MTRASTHPPMVTDPKMFPSSPTNIFVPSLRGVVPTVRTSVAIVARRPALRSRSINSKVSCDMGVAVRVLFERPLAVRAAEVVTASFVLRRVAGVGDRDGHAADRIEGLFGRRRRDHRHALQLSGAPFADDLRDDAESN